VKSPPEPKDASTSLGFFSVFRSRMEDMLTATRRVNDAACEHDEEWEGERVVRGREEREEVGRREPRGQGPPGRKTGAAHGDR
jgi:hypothetical protein